MLEVSWWLGLRGFSVSNASCILFVLIGQFVDDCIDIATANLYIYVMHMLIARLSSKRVMNAGKKAMNRSIATYRFTYAGMIRRY